MDALDEFFRDWCEPEAWCERCSMYPAVHVVIQDDQAAYGSIVTYVRIWDPAAQTHIAVCRQCSAQHIETLGTPEFQYASASDQSGSGPQQSTLWRLIHGHLQRWKRYLRLRLDCRFRRQRSHKLRDRHTYSHTEHS